MNHSIVPVDGVAYVSGINRCNKRKPPVPDWLRKLDDRATMCFIVGYKYEGGGYRVWHPKSQVVVESGDVAFFEGRLPSPILNDPPPWSVDEGESVT